MNSASTCNPSFFEGVLCTGRCTMVTAPVTFLNPRASEPLARQKFNARLAIPSPRGAGGTTKHRIAVLDPVFPAQQDLVSDWDTTEKLQFPFHRKPRVSRRRGQACYGRPGGVNHMHGVLLGGRGGGGR